MKIKLDKSLKKVLGDAFLEEISNVFNWHYSDEVSTLNHERCKSKFSLEDKKGIDAKIDAKSQCAKKIQIS